MYGVTRGVTEGTGVKIFDFGFLNFDWDKDTWTDLGPASQYAFRAARSIGSDSVKFCFSLHPV
jgi:hypothetical protein